MELDENEDSIASSLQKKNKESHMILCRFFSSEYGAWDSAFHSRWSMGPGLQPIPCSLVLMALGCQERQRLLRGTKTATFRDSHHPPGSYDSKWQLFGTSNLCDYWEFAIKRENNTFWTMGDARILQSRHLEETMESEALLSAAFTTC